MICSICPRECGVARLRGYCGMGDEMLIARAAPHFDEEPCISGTRGSGAIFFSGCALKCRFCQNAEISRGGAGKPVSVAGLVEIMNALADAGCHNINMVSPTHFTNKIIEALDSFDKLPIVWNTSGYEKIETIKSLSGYVNVYLPDLKYVDEYSARKYSRAGDYFEFASRAILEMLAQTGAVELDENGVIKKGTIVRHLILPGRVEESKRALDWIKRNLDGAWVSLMAQYTPMGDIEGVDELERRVMRDEYDEICEHMINIGITEGYCQDLASSAKTFIPAFDLTGVPPQ